VAHHQVFKVQRLLPGLGLMLRPAKKSILRSPMKREMAQPCVETKEVKKRSPLGRMVTYRWKVAIMISDPVVNY
jgi:hypothetical protein